MRAAGFQNSDFKARLVTGDRLSIEEIQKFQRLQPERGWAATWRSLKGHPEHPPLYYLGARAAMTWVRDPIVATRGLAAVLGVLALPSCYWLARQLFPEPQVATVALTLFAVSPFQVFYAQEARQYSLLAVALLSSSAALLRAQRRQTLGAWGAYAATVMLGLYASLFFTLAIAAQGLYIGIVEGWRRVSGQFLLAVALGVATFLPWIAVIVSRWQTLRQETSWTQLDFPWPMRLRLWGLHFSTGFLDLGFPLEHPYTAIVPPLFVIASVWALWCLYRRGHQRAALFLGLLVGVNFLALALPDLLFGGRRSLIGRYFSQTYIALQLLAAYWLSDWWERQRTAARSSWLRYGPLAFFLACGVLSCSLSALATTWWWTKPIGTHNAEVAAAINGASAPLVLVGQLDDTTLGNILSLSHLLAPDATIAFAPEPEVLTNYRDCHLFLYAPTPSLSGHWQQESGTRLEFLPHALVRVRRSSCD